MGFIRLLVAAIFGLVSVAFLIDANFTLALLLGIFAALIFASNKRRDPYARERFQESYRRR